MLAGQCHERGGIPWHCLCPPKRELCPPSEDCAPKKLTGWVLLENNSMPETPKILVISPEFVSKNCFFVEFAIKTVCFCGFTPEFMKICVCRGIKTFFFLVFTSDFVEIRMLVAMKTRICESWRIF